MRSRAARWFEEHGHLEGRPALPRGGRRHGRDLGRLLATHGPSAAGARRRRRGPQRGRLLLPELERDAVHRAARRRGLPGARRLGRGAPVLRPRRRATPMRSPPALAWRMGLLEYLRGRLDDAMATYDRAGEEGDSARPRAAPRVAGHGALAPLGDRRVPRGREAGVRDRLGRRRPAGARGGTHRARHARRARGRPKRQRRALPARAGLRRSRGRRAPADPRPDEPRLAPPRGGRVRGGDRRARPRPSARRPRRLRRLPGARAHNRGEARAKLGRLEEAVADLEDAREIYRRLGSRMVAYPLEKLGEIYRERGDWALSRATYEEAISQAEAAGGPPGPRPVALRPRARARGRRAGGSAAALAERAVALGSA